MTRFCDIIGDSFLVCSMAIFGGFGYAVVDFGGCGGAHLCFVGGAGVGT